MIGIFGGTFNPIHLGHLIAAQQVLDAGGCENIIFVPCKIHPFGKNISVSGTHRLEMVKLAIKGYKEMSASDIELASRKVSFTYDTFLKFRKKMPGKKFAIIIGQDNLMQLKNWKNVEQLGKEAKIIIVPLPAEKAPSKKELAMHAGKKAVFLGNCIKTNISSTHIRQEFRSRGKGNPLLYLPSEVYAYAKKHGLYD